MNVFDAELQRLAMLVPPDQKEQETDNEGKGKEIPTIEVKESSSTNSTGSLPAPRKRLQRYDPSKDQS